MDGERIKTAIELVLHLYQGKKDKKGNPEMLHPLTVGMMGTTESEIILGLIHDMVEDKLVSFKALDEFLYLSNEEKIALNLLTHNKAVKTYKEYINDIVRSKNMLAIGVKMRDLRHNISRGTEETRRKHESAIAMFTFEALG